MAVRAKAREQYIVVDQRQHTYIGMSPSLFGAKKISGMNPRTDEDGTVYFGAVYKSSDVTTTPRTDRIDVEPMSEPVAERIRIDGYWGWTDSKATFAYRNRSEQAKKYHDYSTRKYRADKTKSTIYIPREINEAIRAMNPPSINAYVLELIKADLRERGYLFD